MDGSTNVSRGRRKRPRVSEADRKRVAKACESCRQVKEKCEGGVPCSRCKRLGRYCVIKNESRVSDSHTQSTLESFDEYIDKQRIAALEEILKNYAPGLALDKNSLKEHIASLRTTSDHTFAIRATVTPSNSMTSCSEEKSTAGGPLPSAMAMARSGELSHCRFFDSVQGQIDERSGKQRAQHPSAVTATVVSSRRVHLLSNNAVALHAASSLPPLEVSRFLIETFFQFAQTNYFYVDELSLRARMEAIYAHAAALTPNDAPSLCLLLMVLALGTQFAHLSSTTDQDGAIGLRDDIPDDMASPDDNVALALYASATSLLSDVITIGSIESVQAFLLLGVYTLPIDAAGVSHAYLGTAVRLAIQNDMHRQPPKSLVHSILQQRIKIWWTVYTLEKRVSVLHGMPVAVSRSEVDVPMPENDLTSSVSERTSNLSNFIAIIKLTCMLEDVGATIWSLRHTPPEFRSSTVESLSQVHSKLCAYWNSLPDTIVCRDLSWNSPLFRPNIHLAITYHLIRMFIGRTFIFDVTSVETNSTPTEGGSLSWIDLRAKLIHDTIESAITIIELCQLLHDKIGLARASYTEFTSCRTALLSILARRTQENSVRLQTASEQGLELLKFMSVGIYSAAAEKAAIRAMETAVRRLNQNTRADGGAQEQTGQNSAYDNFCNWAKLWTKDGSGHAKTSASHAKSPNFADGGPSGGSCQLPLLTTSPQTDDLNALISTFPFDLDEFASIPGFDPDFTFSMNFSTA